MKKQILFALLLLINFTFAQTGLTNAQVLNIAAKQRSLSQRMAKARVCIGMNILTDVSNKELATSKIIFEENLKLLKNFNGNSAVTAKYDRLVEKWELFRPSLEGTDLDGTKKVMSTNTEVLFAGDALVDEIKNFFKQSSGANKSESENEIAEAIVNAGRLRQYSLRMALYNIYSFGNKTADVNVENIETLYRFDQAITFLLTSQVNTPEIDVLISEVYKDWNLIKDQNKNYRIEPIEMNTKCNKIFSLGDKLVSMYVAL